MKQLLPTHQLECTSNFHLPYIFTSSPYTSKQKNDFISHLYPLNCNLPVFPEKKNTLFPHPGPPRNRPAGDDSLVGAVEVADAEGGLGAVPE